jgi:hypothetical protein
MSRMQHVIAALVVLVSCRQELRSGTKQPVEPPVASPNAIPDAPVSGTLRGAQFVIRDARYVIDRRIGYAHTDIRLSSGKASSDCGPLTPPNESTVWLRLDGDGKLESKEFQLGPDSKGPWSVHYEVFGPDGWMGISGGSAVVQMFEPGPDGHLSGRLAVCFSDGTKSCVSGSFDARPCPWTIDQPVRGTMPPETIPEKYRSKMLDAGAVTATTTPPSGKR